MNFNKLGIIIQREYLNRVKKKSFLVITFLAPVLFAAIAVLPTFIMMGTKEEAKRVGVIDRSGIVLSYLEDNEVTTYTDLGPDADADSLKTSLKAAGIDVLLSISELDPENRTVQADCYSEKPLGMDTGSLIENRINDAVEAYRIASYGIPDLENILEGVKSDVKLHSYTIDSSGKETISESSVYMFLSLLLGMAIYLFVTMFSAMVMSSVIEEKSSRVVEVLVSSVRSSELMFGKILGVALVAFTQFFLWIVLTLILVAGSMAVIGKEKLADMGLAASQSVSVSASVPGADDALSTLNLDGMMPAADSLATAAGEPSAVKVVLDTLSNIDLPQLVIAFILYFIFGYLLYASLFAAIGSAVENEGDSNQLQLPVTIPLMLGFFVAIYAFKAPDSQLVFWFSMIPFTSPIVMLARLPFTVPAWELWLSIGLLVATFVACAWASAKIYKVGILMYGKKSTFKDLWKWLRMK